MLCSSSGVNVVSEELTENCICSNNIALHALSKRFCTVVAQLVADFKSRIKH